MLYQSFLIAFHVILLVDNLGHSYIVFLLICMFPIYALLLGAAY